MGENAMDENLVPPVNSPVKPMTLEPDDHMFRVLVENIKDFGIFVLTPTGHIASWNKGNERIQGYSSEEILGKHFSIFYTPESIAKGWPKHELVRAAADGRFEDEGWRIRKDGQRFWANVVITAMHDEQGKLIGYSKITRDLTERKKQEDRIRQSEERFRLLVESVRDYAIFMLDVDGKVMSWNSGAERIKGYKAPEIIGQSFTRFYTEEDLKNQKPWHMLHQARQYGSTREVGWRVRKDGTRFMAEVVITALYDTNGVLQGYAKITRDRRQEDRIKTLETEGRRLNEFLAMLAHELRNPLASLRNAITLMEVPKLSPAKLKWAQGVIHNQTEHLTRLVDDLLDIGRITNGKISLYIEQLDLKEIIQRGIDTNFHLLKSRQHDVKLYLPDEAVHVEGDKVRLVQVISNLLNNAAKYTAPGGAIDIATETKDHSVILSIKDNGAGIPPDLIDKVFDLFQQGERGIDRADAGLGIGLSLVRQIVKMHHGNIEARSAGVGQGSEFILTLPVATATAKPAVPSVPVVSLHDDKIIAIANPACAANLRVLVVDDNRDAADSLAMLIETIGNHAKTVHDGLSVAEVARQYRPDLVLLDIGLPGMSGYEVARQFKNDVDLRHIRLVALTGYSQALDKQMAKDAGFDEFMVKPLPLERLKTLMNMPVTA